MTPGASVMIPNDPISRKLFGMLIGIGVNPDSVSQGISNASELKSDIQEFKNSVVEMNESIKVLNTTMQELNRNLKEVS